MASLIASLRTRIRDPHLITISQFMPRQDGLYLPTSLAAIRTVEAELGFRLPSLLRVLYTEVTNGGFGLGYGLFGVEGGYSVRRLLEAGISGIVFYWIWGEMQMKCIYITARCFLIFCLKTKTRCS
jgi:hypothetical protein